MTCFSDHPHRRDGIGRQLITWLCNEGAADGGARIDWIVAADNESGRGFFE
jgi:ribosomal protein S18 acetylase RimI-like enzyme